MSVSAKTLEDLLDRENIRDVLVRYAHAIDRRDIDMLKSVFWPDAVEDHGTSVFTDMDVLASNFMAIIDASEIAVHHLSLPMIQLEGNTAKVSTYVISHHRMRGQTRPHWTFPPRPLTDENKDDLQDFFTGNRYIDIFEKRGDEWRVKYRKIAHDWFRVAESQRYPEQYPFKGYENFNFGSCSSEDIGAKLFEEE